MNLPSGHSFTNLLARWLAVLAAILVHTSVCHAAILIVKSENLPQYQAPIAAFRQAVARETVEIDIGGSRETGSRLLREIASERKPEAVFALGAKAAYLSKELLPDTPMVFAMVLGWSRYDLIEGSVTGVAVEIPEEALFTRFKLMLPRLRTLGVIYSRETDPRIITNARKAATALNLNLREEVIDHSGDAAGAYRRMRSEIQALWMVPDPMVVTRDTFAYLAHRTRSDHIAFLAFSENFVRAGALLSIAPSYETMGSQAAVLLERLLASPGDAPPVQAPLGSTLVVNGETAKTLGINLNSTVINMADHIIDPSLRGN